MSEMKKEQENSGLPEQRHMPGNYLAIPFFVVLAILTIVAFLIPLRPTVSYSEKRELASFPEFSMDSLLSGDYFDDITLWFSDTFPGRETWISLSNVTESLHGYSEIAIVEGDFLEEIINPAGEDTPASIPDSTPAPDTETSPTGAPPADEDPTQQTTEETAPQEETTPQETQWGGVDAGDDAEISLGAVIQIGDSAFNQIGFSEVVSKRYIAAISKLADALAQKGVQVVSAPAPLSVGIMVEPEYQDKLRCARQDEMVTYLHSGMSENVITVDTYNALVTHNSEYLYFRTDHHWTALGAYYAYAAICQELGQEAAALDSFQEIDNGEFLGSLSSKVRYPTRLRSDTVYAYMPPGEITMYNVYNSSKVETPLLQDMTHRTIHEKYLTFLCGDNALQMIVNESLPEGSTCLIVKDSFGNCFAPFMTQNYHTVYVMDYRSYYSMTIQRFVDTYDVDTVLMIPYLMATQSMDGASLFEWLCG